VRAKRTGHARSPRELLTNGNPFYGGDCRRGRPRHSASTWTFYTNENGARETERAAPLAQATRSPAARTSARRSGAARRPCVYSHISAMCMELSAAFCSILPESIGVPHSSSLKMTPRNISRRARGARAQPQGLARAPEVRMRLTILRGAGSRGARARRRRSRPGLL
jgi:hypothetical protein